MEIESLTTEDKFKQNLPQHVYKYRTWTDSIHKTVISNQTVYLAPPNSFEDKKDCKLFKRFDLITDEEIYNRYLNSSKESHPSWSRQQHRSFAREWAKKSPLRNHEYVRQMQLQHFEEFNKQFGVLSLTTNCASLPMWEKYSDSHRGFCVGFSTNEMFKQVGGGGEVIYCEELPVIMPSDDINTELIKQIFSKEKKWEFEEEYRTFHFSEYPLTSSQRQTVLAKDCYKHIIFGAKMPEEHKDEIMRICQEQSLNVDFFSAIIENDETIRIDKILSNVSLHDS